MASIFTAPSCSSGTACRGAAAGVAPCCRAIPARVSRTARVPRVGQVGGAVERADGGGGHAHGGHLRRFRPVSEMGGDGRGRGGQRRQPAGGRPVRQVVPCLPVGAAGVGRTGVLSGGRDPIRVVVGQGAGTAAPATVSRTVPGPGSTSTTAARSGPGSASTARQGPAPPRGHRSAQPGRRARKSPRRRGRGRLTRARARRAFRGRAVPKASVSPARRIPEAGRRRAAWLRGERAAVRLLRSGRFKGRSRRPFVHAGFPVPTKRTHNGRGGR